MTVAPVWSHLGGFGHGGAKSGREATGIYTGWVVFILKKTGVSTPRKGQNQGCFVWQGGYYSTWLTVAPARSHGVGLGGPLPASSPLNYLSRRDVTRVTKTKSHPKKSYFQCGMLSPASAHGAGVRAAGHMTLGGLLLLLATLPGARAAFGVIDTIEPKYGCVSFFVRRRGGSCR